MSECYAKSKTWGCRIYRRRRSTSEVQKQKWMNKQKRGMHVSVRECKKSSSRWRTEEMSAFSVCFCPAHPFPAELHFFPQTKLHFSRPCLSVPRWRAQRTRAPAIRLDPQCTSCQTSRFLSFLIGNASSLGTSPYVGTGTTCFLHKLWALWDGLHGQWSLTTDPIGFWIFHSVKPHQYYWLNQVLVVFCRLLSNTTNIWACSGQLQMGNLLKLSSKSCCNRVLSSVESYLGSWVLEDWWRGCLRQQ